MQNNNYELHILGSRGTHSAFGDEFKEFGGQTSCYVIKSNDYALIIDCGTGLFNAKEILSGVKKIDVLLTHVHYDHIVGLIDERAILSNIECTFYGTFSKWSNSNVFADFLRKPFWPVNTIVGNTININNDGSVYKLNDEVSFKAYKAPHPDDASMFIINVNDKKVCILSDFGDANSVETNIINGGDFLFFDGTLNKEDAIKYKEWGHSCWNQGVELAKKENIKNLIITHHNPAYNDEILRKMEDDCKNEFANSRFARCGDKYKL